jgi:hypothetical protein
MVTTNIKDGLVTQIYNEWCRTSKISTRFIVVNEYLNLPIGYRPHHEEIVLLKLIDHGFMSGYWKFRCGSFS